MTLGIAILKEIVWICSVVAEQKSVEKSLHS